MLILNEKKARIKQLSELLDASENGDLTVKKVPSKRKGKKRKTDEKVTPKVTKKEVVSDSEPEERDDINTDEEVETKNFSEDTQQPSTSTSILDKLDQSANGFKQIKSDTQGSPEEKSSSLLDIFFDAPSTSGLPKRQKTDRERNIEVLVIPKVPTEKIETPPEPVIKGRKIPDIELNTQQLLDML